MVLTNQQFFSGQNESSLPLGNTKLVKIFLVTAVLWQLYHIWKFIGLDPAVDISDESIAPTKIDWNWGTSIASSTLELPRESTTTTTLAYTNTTTTTAIENTMGKASTQPDSKLTSAIWAKIRNECFGLNSDPWITGNIASNNAANITSELLDTLIEGPTNFLKLPSLFDQTFAARAAPTVISLPKPAREHELQSRIVDGGLVPAIPLPRITLEVS